MHSITVLQVPVFHRSLCIPFCVSEPVFLSPQLVGICTGNVGAFEGAALEPAVMGTLADKQKRYNK